MHIYLYDDHIIATTKQKNEKEKKKYILFLSLSLSHTHNYKLNAFNGVAAYNYKLNCSNKQTRQCVFVCVYFIK